MAKTTHPPAGQPSFSVTTEDHILIGRIVKRWVAARAKHSLLTSADDRTTFDMDLTACHANGSPLNLARLLDSSDFDFAHDVSQVQKHIDRTTGKMPAWFHPRCNR